MGFEDLPSDTSEPGRFELSMGVLVPGGIVRPVVLPNRKRGIPGIRRCWVVWTLLLNALIIWTPLLLVAKL